MRGVSCKWSCSSSLSRPPVQLYKLTHLQRTSHAVAPELYFVLGIELGPAPSCRNIAHQLGHHAIFLPFLGRGYLIGVRQLAHGDLVQDDPERVRVDVLGVALAPEELWRGCQVEALGIERKQEGCALVFLPHKISQSPRPTPHPIAATPSASCSHQDRCDGSRHSPRPCRGCRPPPLSP